MTIIFNRLSHFYIVFSSEVKDCCSKFLLNSGYCVLIGECNGLLPDV